MEFQKTFHMSASSALKSCLSRAWFRDIWLSISRCFALFLTCNQQFSLFGWAFSFTLTNMPCGGRSLLLLLTSITVVMSLITTLIRGPDIIWLLYRVLFYWNMSLFSKEKSKVRVDSFNIFLIPIIRKLVHYFWAQWSPCEIEALLPGLAAKKWKSWLSPARKGETVFVWDQCGV